MNANKNNFDSMLAIAKVAEEWHHNRRQLEFRIMISYTTLLALAFYQAIKPRPGSETMNFEDYWVIILIGGLGLLLVLVIYCQWQYIFHIASNNDVRRRDFYLKKAEVMLHYRLRSRDSQFVPSFTRTVMVNLAVERSKEMSEVELFNEAEPDIYIPSKKIGTPPPKWYKNKHILIPLIFPTILTFSLIVVLFIKADVIENIVTIWRSL